MGLALEVYQLAHYIWRDFGWSPTQIPRLMTQELFLAFGKET